MYNKSEIFTQANKFISQGKTRSEAFKKAWSNAQMARMFSIDTLYAIQPKIAKKVKMELSEVDKYNWKNNPKQMIAIAQDQMKRGVA